jgi:hypothetical protein
MSHIQLEECGASASEEHREYPSKRSNLGTYTMNERSCICNFFHFFVEEDEDMSGE